MALARKLKRVLEQRFPPPDKIDLRDVPGNIAAIAARLRLSLS